MNIPRASSTKKIELTQGKTALVSSVDYEELSKYKWRAKKVQNEDYWRVVRTIKGGKMLLMHRVIMNPPEGMVVDHINHDTFDNRRENLRVCTQAENARNTRGHKDSGSGLKGVYWDKVNSKWKVEICVNYKRIWLGRFLNMEEAKQTYNEAAKKYYGEFASLNK